MKNIFKVATIAVLAAGVSSNAFAAASDSTEIEINATAENVCYISSAPSNTGSNSNLITSDIDNSLVEIADFIDDTTALLNPATIILNYGDSYCNYGHSIQMQSANGGLAQTSGASQVAGSGTFINHVNYTATATMALQSNSLTTNGTGVETSTATGVSGANRANLIVNIVLDNTPTDPVLQGEYEDTLTVKIGATI